MSRGMQQKVAIARALLTSPTVLLLDEPTTGLDPRSKLDVQTFIEEVRDTHDATIVLTTHDLAEAERLCDRIALINDGRVVARGDAGRARGAGGARPRPGADAGDVFMTFTGRSLDDDVEDENRGRRGLTDDHRDARAEGEPRLRRAQLQPDEALLGLGSRLARLLAGGRPGGGPHRRGPGRPGPAPGR